ncbi:hypothetical protein BN2127_JRS10_04604 [Bacillus subtilis]|nr:hypothetical protein BN2127_JRS10_04604 [Bacillus subtilis]
MNIKPIETIYKGYRFRSRLEARWAVFFDTLGIKWRYENEGYDLGKLGWYLPDFEIETESFGKWFVEIKGDKNDIVGIKKAQFLDHYTPDEFMGCRIFSQLEILNSNGYADSINAEMLCVSVSDYNRAIIKAKQARFEHGEIPL